MFYLTSSCFPLCSFHYVVVWMTSLNVNLEYTHLALITFSTVLVSLPSWSVQLTLDFKSIVNYVHGLARFCISDRVYDQSLHLGIGTALLISFVNSLWETFVTVLFDLMYYSSQRCSERYFTDEVSLEWKVFRVSLFIRLLFIRLFILLFYIDTDNFNMLL